MDPLSSSPVCAPSASEAGAACLLSAAAPPLHLLARPADRRCWHGAGIEAYNRQLTSMLCLTGASMLPTLNPNAKGQDSAKDKLLMRLLPRAEQGRTVFVDDVVAFNPPFAAGNDGVMVRRVAAMEGEEMVSSDKEDEAFELPQGRHQPCSRYAGVDRGSGGDLRPGAGHASLALPGCLLVLLFR